MKTQHLTFKVLLVLVTLYGCQKPVHEQFDITITDDVTGSNGYHSIDITMNDIHTLTGVAINPFNYGKVRVSTLSDVSLNVVQQVKLDSVPSMDEYQKYTREAEIKRFLTDADSLIQGLQNNERGKLSSSLLRPIHKELRRLAKSSATRKYAIFYTDLQEHSSSLFSSYSTSDMKFLRENRKEFTKNVLAKAPLPDLTGWIV